MKQYFLAVLAAALTIGHPAAAQSARHIQQRLLEIPNGQYSGITRIQDDTYAVVHDKAAGGGLFILTLSMNADGTIGPVSIFKADADGPEGLDNEDVVFVPETKTLFISAEGDQSIREYRLDGRATGRELAVPDFLKKPEANKGFEALAYADGTFWTTTETPLPGETLHRLQSFHLDSLQPGPTYYYSCDQPLRPAEETAAYVHGISAMTALPDGRLAVLEREVYVPGSNAGLLARLLGSFTFSSIYLVDPRASQALETLPKTLLTAFFTSALSLANFEGMCLGPVLPDGSQTLLLIADSQDGYSGLTGEHIRVLAY